MLSPLQELVPLHEFIPTTKKEKKRKGVKSLVGKGVKSLVESFGVYPQLFLRNCLLLNVGIFRTFSVQSRVCNFAI